MSLPICNRTDDDFIGSQPHMLVDEDKEIWRNTGGDSRSRGGPNHDGDMCHTEMTV